MTDEMYEDLLERNKLQISELNTLTEEQDRHIIELEKENAELKAFESHCDEIEEDAKAIAKENAELKAKLDEIRNYLTYDIPHELMNEATNKIWRMV